MTRKHRQSNLASAKSDPHRRKKPGKRSLIWLWVTLGIMLMAVGGFLLLRPTEVDSIGLSLAQANTKLQQGAFFLDVRTQQEWDQFRIAGSTLIPVDELPNRLNELPKDQDIVVVCQTGLRAESGVTILQQAGFSRVSSLIGGLQAWINAGYPVESGLP